MPIIGSYPSSIAISDKIYIMHGGQNSTQYLIYNTTSNTIESIEYEDEKTDTYKLIASVLYKNRILKLGGYSCEKEVIMDTFIMSNEIKPDGGDDDGTTVDTLANNKKSAKSEIAMDRKTIMEITINT